MLLTTEPSLQSQTQFLNKIKSGAGEMAQRLRALIALPEVPVQFLATTWWVTTIYNVTWCRLLVCQKTATVCSYKRNKEIFLKKRTTEQIWIIVLWDLCPASVWAWIPSFGFAEDYVTLGCSTWESIGSAWSQLLCPEQTSVSPIPRQPGHLSTNAFFQSRQMVASKGGWGAL